MLRPQRGFTLVELSIVLLIVGLLLGGVLKGQALIDSAKVKNLAQDLRSIPALAHAYQDKYRALPGDDIGAVLHLCGSAAACTRAGDGNGMVDGDWDASGDAESLRFWQHLRLAGIATGSTELTAPASRRPTPSAAGSACSAGACSECRAAWRCARTASPAVWCASSTSRSTTATRPPAPCAPARAARAG